MFPWLLVHLLFLRAPLADQCWLLPWRILLDRWLRLSRFYSIEYFSFQSAPETIHGTFTVVTFIVIPQDIFGWKKCFCHQVKNKFGPELCRTPVTPNLNILVGFLVKISIVCTTFVTHDKAHTQSCSEDSVTMAIQWCDAWLVVKSRK